MLIIDVKASHSHIFICRLIIYLNSHEPITGRRWCYGEMVFGVLWLTELLLNRVNAHWPPV